jgi:hypothetical protein
VVECLPRKHEALSSNPSTAKKKAQVYEIFRKGTIFLKICVLEKTQIAEVMVE